MLHLITIDVAVKLAYYFPINVQISSDLSAKVSTGKSTLWVAFLFLRSVKILTGLT